MKANDEKKLDYNVFQSLFDMPVMKVLLVCGAVVGIIFVSGQIFRVVGNSITHYKGMKSAINS